MFRVFFLAGTSLATLTCPSMASAQSSTETYAHSDADAISCSVFHDFGRAGA
jgi:hypothetical protein